MYQAEEGRGIDYKDKMAEQEEISTFVNKIFGVFPFFKQLNFEHFSHITKSVSSEMFVSLIALLH
jgi:hypothetical protein